MVIWSFVLKEHFLYLFKIWDLRVSSQQKVGECRKGRWYCENITQYIKQVLILKSDCEESNKHCTTKRKNEINQVTAGCYLLLLSVLPSSKHERHLNGWIPSVHPRQSWKVRGTCELIYQRPLSDYIWTYKGRQIQMSNFSGLSVFLL